jgi:hypothetical protein
LLSYKFPSSTSISDLDRARQYCDSILPIAAQDQIRFFLIPDDQSPAQQPIFANVTIDNGEKHLPANIGQFKTRANTVSDVFSCTSACIVNGDS